MFLLATVGLCFGTQVRNFVRKMTLFRERQLSTDSYWRRLAKHALQSTSGEPPASLRDTDLWPRNHEYAGRRSWRRYRCRNRGPPIRVNNRLFIVSEMTHFGLHVTGSDLRKFRNDHVREMFMLKRRIRRRSRRRGTRGRRWQKPNACSSRYRRASADNPSRKPASPRELHPLQTPQDAAGKNETAPKPLSASHTSANATRRWLACSAYAVACLGVMNCLATNQHTCSVFHMPQGNFNLYGGEGPSAYFGFDDPEFSDADSQTGPELDQQWATPWAQPPEPELAVHAIFESDSDIASQTSDDHMVEDFDDYEPQQPGLPQQQPQPPPEATHADSNNELAPPSPSEGPNHNQSSRNDRDVRDPLPGFPAGSHASAARKAALSTWAILHRWINVPTSSARQHTERSISKAKQPELTPDDIAAAQENAPYIPAKGFCGNLPGYIFTSREGKTGYYVDDPPQMSRIW